MVVEDDEAVARISQRLLELEGFQGDVTLTAADARSLMAARVRAHMRRTRVSGPADITCGNLTLSRRLRNASVEGKQVNLTAKEYFLLEYFVANAGRVVTRKELLERVWKLDFDPGTNVVDVNVSRLRTKLSGYRATCLLESERGIGYVFRPD